MNKLKSFLKYALLFSFGGMLYMILELLFRGRTDYTMSFCGGICFILIGLINNIFTWEMRLTLQGVIGGVIITTVELIFGLLFNQDFHIWDYRNMPFNFIGQICLPFSILWIFISIAAVILDDYLRCYMFGEDKPHYAL